MLTIALIAALGIQPEPASRSDGASEIEQDRSYRASLLRDAEIRGDLSSATTDGRFSLDVTMHNQIRYTAAFRRDPPAGEEDTILGFQNRRNKLGVKGNVASENLEYNVVLVSSGGGSSVVIETATLRANLGDGWAVLVGQAKLPFFLERTISSTKQLAADRSRVARVFDQGFSEFVEVSLTRDRWRGFAAFSDGLNSQNTSFTADPADAAITLRGEVRLGKAPWKAFSDFISFPGSEFGVMLGGAVHVETGGETFGSVDQDLISATADATVKGDGWNAHASFVWRSIDPAGGESLEDFGVVAQGGFFLDPHNEVFVRWDTVFPDDSRTTSNDPFSTLTAGLNHYLFEKSHAVVVTGDVQYLVDPLEGGIISGTTSLGQFADGEGGQTVVRLQLEVVF